MSRYIYHLALQAMLVILFQSACSGALAEDAKMTSAMKNIYFAGGCFWGVEEFFSRLPGVVRTEVGYANSDIPQPDYGKVCSGATNAAETVHVCYDPERTTLQELARQFFRIIDPLSVNRQGHDIGTQYRTGIYFVDNADKDMLLPVFAAEQASAGQPLAVELEPLRNFWAAEEVHQAYLKKNPGGYCHVDFSILDRKDDGYSRPSDIELRQKLPPETYHVTRENGTEPPFSGKYWNHQEAGIYVDAISGEPLFVSAKKFDSGCGWPSFTEPVDTSAIKQLEDLSHGMRRIEVRSRLADSHLGHVFNDGPNGSLRYCINSAALRFVPYSRMDAEGYGPWKTKVLKDAPDNDSATTPHEPGIERHAR